MSLGDGAVVVPHRGGLSLFGIRVLGVRLGWVRAVLCAWFGLATASFALTALTNEERPKFVLEVTLGLLTMLAWAELFALVLAVRRTDASPPRA